MNIMNASPAGRVVTADGQFAICRLFALEASAPVVPNHHRRLLLDLEVFTPKDSYVRRNIDSCLWTIYDARTCST